MLLVAVNDAGEDGSYYYKPWKSNDRPVDVDCGILNTWQLQNGADRFVDSGVQVVTTGDEVRVIHDANYSASKGLKA